jgi:probable HAF family extracellular repeat protein
VGDEAFRWQAGVMEGLGDLGEGGFLSTGFAASADGSVVVGRANTDPINLAGNEAFRWENGSMVGLGVLPGQNESWAWDVSDDGSVVVGDSRIAFVANAEAFRWENGVMEDLGFLPGGYESTARGVSADGSVVVGFSYSEVLPIVVEAFRWENGVMEGLGVLPNPYGVFGSQANAVSADGSFIVGGSYGASGYLEAFLWSNGTMMALGHLPGDRPDSEALSVSADGTVVVGRGAFAGCPGFECVWEAFIWTPDGGMRTLKGFLEGELALDLTGWTLLEARGVSDDGLTIVGVGRNPNGELEGWVVRHRRA